MKTTIGKAILGGFVATLAMTILMYTAAPMMGVKMDIAAMLGSMLGGWTIGLIAHIMNGAIIFPLFYALLVYRRLAGSPLLRGLQFGAGLWLLSQVLVMPMMGAGMFSSHAGGLMAAAASLAGHLVYGGIVGALAGGAHPASASADYTSVLLKR